MSRPLPTSEYSARQPFDGRRADGHRVLAARRVGDASGLLVAGGCDDERTLAAGVPHRRRDRGQVALVESNVELDRKVDHVGATVGRVSNRPCDGDLVAEAARVERTDRHHRRAVGDAGDARPLLVARRSSTRRAFRARCGRWRCACRGMKSYGLRSSRSARSGERRKRPRSLVGDAGVDHATITPATALDDRGRATRPRPAAR